MTRIYLIRHGFVDNPRQLFYGPDTPLSERGRRQINALIERFRDAGIVPTRLYTSPYARTRATADLFAGHFSSSPLTVIENLKEWQVGPWYDKPLADFYAATGYRQHASVALPPPIESLETCSRRIRSVIAHIIDTNPHATVFIISHREPMVSALLSYQQASWELIHDFPFPFASSWRLDFERADALPLLEKSFDCSDIL